MLKRSHKRKSLGRSLKHKITDGSDKNSTISWKDVISNDKVGKGTRQRKLEDIMRVRRLCWLDGHFPTPASCFVIFRSCIFNAPLGTCEELSAEVLSEAVSWFPPGGKTKIGGPRIDWTQAMKEDISRGCFIWNDLPALIADRKQRKN